MNDETYEYFWLTTGGGNNDQMAAYSLVDGHRFAIQNKIVQGLQSEFGRQITLTRTRAPIDGAYGDRPTQQEKDMMIEYLNFRPIKMIEDVMRELKLEHQSLGRPAIHHNRSSPAHQQIYDYPIGEIYRVLKKRDDSFARVMTYLRRFGLPTVAEWTYVEQDVLPYIPREWQEFLVDESLDLQTKIFNENYMGNNKKILVDDPANWSQFIDRRFLFWLTMDNDHQLEYDIKLDRQKMFYQQQI